MRSLAVLAVAVLALLGSAPARVRAQLPDAAAALLLDGTHPDPDALAHAARAAGSDAPTVHALETTLDDGGDLALRAWITDLRTRSDAPLACGEARSGTRRLTLATARGGWLDEILLDTSDAPAIRGDLAPGFDAPTLAIRDAAGTPRRLTVERPRLAAGVALPADLDTPALVQLVARGPSGPRPVAERVVGGPPDAGDATLSTHAATGADVPAILDTLRASAHAHALRPN